MPELYVQAVKSSLPLSYAALHGLPLVVSSGGEGGGGGWEGLEGGLGFIATCVTPERSDAGPKQSVFSNKSVSSV
jgi:hypothetical protein